MSGGALSADFTVSRPRFDVTARVEVAAGGCLALLGPNGAGKSTVLAGLAGLAPLRSGQILLDGDRIDGLAPERRRIALLDQSGRLFPHLSVASNIAFGAQARGVGRSEVRDLVGDWLDRIDLADRARAKPHELSGGQQQRVAIARAFASRPRVLLLDEPFAALDAQSAPIVRRVLADELDRTGTTAVLVTHEMPDAWQWADECLVMHDGVVVESAAPADLALHPRRAFTATLAGFDVIDGVWRDGALHVDGRQIAGVSDGTLPDGGPAIGIVAAGEVSVTPARVDTAVGHPDPDYSTAAWPLTAVSARAGVVRLETACGLAAELPTEAAVRVGGGRLPVPGQRYVLTPETMRVVGID